MNRRRVLPTAVLLLLAISCHKQAPTPRQVIILLDVSGSIEPDAQKEAMAGIQTLAGRLERGDSITLIPITGDAATESSGKILRLERPVQRETFDADLQRFKADVLESTETINVEQLKHPGSMTDIMGALRVASEEIAMDQNQHKATVVVLSDFIEEDGAINFKTDPRLTSKTNAELLADEWSNNGSIKLQGVQILLGSIRSKDLGKLSQSRKEAITEFWKEYCLKIGAHANFVIDGIGMMQTGLK